MKKLILLSALFLSNLLVFGQGSYINPGLSLVTCNNEVILKYKSKVRVTNKDKSVVNGKIIGFEENAILVRGGSRDVKLELNNIEKIKVHRIGEALACCASPIIAIPIYYALTTKTFYFNKDVKVDSKKKVLFYKVKELQLDQLFYGKSNLCR